MFQYSHETFSYKIILWYCSERDVIRSEESPAKEKSSMYSLNERLPLIPKSGQKQDGYKKSKRNLSLLKPILKQWLPKLVAVSKYHQYLWLL